MELDIVDNAHSSESLEQPTDSFIRKRKWCTFKYGILNHAVGFVFAATLTVAVIGFCLWLIYDEYEKGAKYGITSWCEGVIAFLLGIWVTDRPKFGPSKTS